MRPSNRIIFILIIITIIFSQLLRLSSCEKDYKLGDTGPAGGIIFFDKGEKTNGWRYLEVAPVYVEFKSEWGVEVYGKAVIGTNDSIGSGKKNTDIIAAIDTESAAYKCKQLKVNKYTDWFLPSKDELDMIQKVLYRQKLGAFSSDPYWSSSVYIDFKNRYYAVSQHFSEGVQRIFNYNSDYERHIKLDVRAVRAF